MGVGAAALVVGGSSSQETQLLRVITFRLDHRGWFHRIGDVQPDYPLGNVEGETVRDIAADVAAVHTESVIAEH